MFQMTCLMFLSILVLLLLLTFLTFRVKEKGKKVEVESCEISTLSVKLGVPLSLPDDLYSDRWHLVCICKTTVSVNRSLRFILNNCKICIFFGKYYIACLRCGIYEKKRKEKEVTRSTKKSKKVSKKITNHANYQDKMHAIKKKKETKRIRTKQRCLTTKIKY